jgi:uncharacterized protein with GYD domain
MPYFFIEGSYTSEGWAALARNPEDREKTFTALVERAGGKLKAFYYAFGASDVIGIIEMPDAASAGAIAVSVASVGHLKFFKTTPLMTNLEGMEVMKKAGSLKYQAPKG